MTLRVRVDRDAVAAVCRARGVRRMRVFGSATGDRFDEVHSDVDLLVEFQQGVADPFDAYFGLKEDLEELFGRRVDLVMADAIRNPYFEAGAVATAEELYAA
ncbi:nucleotidyltransferase family protein [Agromyces mangrovi Wang et al. 2018]|uniref:nucleotidyltransferase family protein n=1 Tax=Agromyces mangrovi TaxID=1858653 RepID=UPI002572D1D2|nr:nucleotidyltransferase domain-containing protein [Agromyces mangrovi]BDZ65561.1 nucleotidyltransferase [Agromyces mangrovi]